MKVKSESEVAQSCPTLSDPMDCSLPGSSVHGIFQEYWSGVPFPSLAKQETQVQSLVQEDYLEEKMAITPVSLPGEFHEQGSMVGSISMWS